MLECSHKLEHLPCPSWAPKNWCFWTVVLEKTLESPLDCKINQSILKEISPGCSLEELMLKLKLQYFGHLMRRVDSLEKTLMLGGIEGRRRRGWQRMRWLDGITNLMDVSLSELQELGGLACCNSWGRKESDMTEQLNWSELRPVIKTTYSSFLKDKTINAAFLKIALWFDINNRHCENKQEKLT